MIILDYSAVAVANIFVHKMHNDLSEELLRHTILNTIRRYNSQFREEYGKLYIACDNSSWRKREFEFYKANRKKGRETSDLDWGEIFGWLNNFVEELDQCMPYPTIKVKGAEADDIIAVLVENSQEFGKKEKILILSPDKDFLQLQRYSNVEQFSTMKKAKLVEKDPHRHLFEHILRGDTSDGVPNILSDSDTFITEGKRQTPLGKKKIDALYEGFLANNLQFEKVEHEINFHRNQKMIDLSKIPGEVVSSINAAIDEKLSAKPISSNTVLNYFIKNRCKKLIPVLSDFM